MQISRYGRWATTILLLAFLADSVTAQCVHIECRRSGDYPSARVYDDFEISKSDRYCLTENITVGRKFVISEGGEKSNNAPIGYINASDVEINLQGNSLVANAVGTWVLDAGNYKRRGEVSVAHLIVRNGILRSRTVSGLRATHLLGPYFGSVISDFTLVFSDPQAVLQDDIIEPLSKIRNNFPVTGHRLLNLTIDVGAWGIHPKRRIWQSGVAIQGAGNEIRDSTITTSDAHAGIYLFGPKQIIENNTIIFKGSPSAPSGAPIKLHAADNSIIRNNTIVVEGWVGKPDAAISLIDSRNVVIENNRIIGVKQLYKVWDDRSDQRSSVIERGNKFPTLWEQILRR